LSSNSLRPVIHVVAGAVIDESGRVLIAQRPAGTHLAGGWEFPGGKLEPGEERLAGLARELNEELGISIATPRPLIRVRHSYPTREVLLDVWVVKRYSGEPHGLDGQALRWCTQEELGGVPLLPADGPIVRALRLPETLREVSTAEYVIGEAGLMADCGARLCGVFCDDVEQAVDDAAAGADFLVMRAALAGEALAALCWAVSVPVYARGVELEAAWELGASGVSEIDTRCAAKAADSHRRIV
jgi:8-oxo-dGTP diphosphatase